MKTYDKMPLKTVLAWAFKISVECLLQLKHDIFGCIFLNENVWISIKISLKFVPKDPINNIPALVKTMAWHRPRDKPLSEPMMASLLTHICVTWLQWVKWSHLGNNFFIIQKCVINFLSVCLISVNIHFIQFHLILETVSQEKNSAHKLVKVHGKFHRWAFLKNMYILLCNSISYWLGATQNQPCYGLNRLCKCRWNA